MPWMVDKERSQAELASVFREKMLGSSIFRLPGAHDGMSALLAKKAGFEALYLSGAAYTASRGLPDLGMVTSEELTVRAKDLIRATDLPVLVDIDTGFGGILNTARTAREMVEARVAAVQIEDQELPKKCGHLNGKKLVAPEEMMQKIKVIKEVAPSLIVVARTDAAGVEGIDQALERANLYIEAGADAIFPEALTTEEEFLTMKSMVNAPLLANMTEFGKTPYYSADEFEQFGYSMVIYPVTSLRVAAKAIENVYREIYDKGTQRDFLNKMQTRKELYETIRYYDFEELDASIAKTVLSEK
ncbi:MAG TPA: methylisocitrate lyase [Bacillus sp. (in: firmicutes)]|uniref:methylisocitrate lyase n=1 Tax=Bacillus litorisediminis TaxID=2922713 RepID=UPI001FADB265|nr:methylisocitrate lyase [Bacillus litorisediminis]HWO76129.1 methylisocitrate lyase [Bacillus sp. (in: firmicutes)]